MTDDITTEPSSDYETLRKQFLSLRTLANSKSRQASHWRNQCGIETRETLLANADNVNAERETNQMLTDSLLAAESERDQVKAENEALKHQISAGAAREWDLRSQVKAARESRARVVKSNQTLRKDAYRYNWFRDCGNDWHEVIVIDSHGRIICDEVDDAIDAAMSAGK